MNPFAMIGNALGGNVLGSADKILGRFIADKDTAGEQGHTEQLAVLQAYQSEFGSDRVNRTWWDSFVDGLNRLVRPSMTYGVIGLFVWCAFDPVSFTETMLALQAVPEMLWWILLTIVGFWFGSRILDKAPRKVTMATNAPQIAEGIATRRRARENDLDTTTLASGEVIVWEKPIAQP